MKPEDLLAHIRSQPKGRASFKHLVRTLGAGGKRRAALRSSLDELVASGDLIESRRGHYKLPGPKSGYVSGRFLQHPAGFGFVQPTRPIPGVAGDVYIHPRFTSDAMHHDRVLVELTRIGTDGRAEGRIKKVLFRQQMLLVGRFRYSRSGSVVDPYDERVAGPVEILPDFEVPPEDVLSERLGQVDQPQVKAAAELDGMMVTVALVELPSRFHLARGKVVEVLGDVDDFGVDVEVVIRKHHLPYRFTAEALKAAEAIPDEISDDEIKNRRDFRDLPIVTIDGETARDFDDAVYVRKLDDGAWELQVHIADVSHYVERDSPLDKEARQRGNSAYFPDRAVPMLPARLSTGICSLNPHVDRLVLSALLKLSRTGEIVSTELCRGVIRSAERMTYTAVFAILEGDAEARARYAPLIEGFERMGELSEVLQKKRKKRGALDLDLPEPVIEFDEQGRMTSVRASERNAAHRLIEEFMLAANEGVARRLTEKNYGLLHRVHEKPSAKSIAEFEFFAEPFGVSLGLEVGAKHFQRSRRRRDGTKSLRTVSAPSDVDVTARDLQRLVDKIRGRPEERVLNQRLLRALKQARYSEEAKGHFALATRHYLHFTSPIRRYPDLVVHRVVKAFLEETPKSPYKADEPGGPYNQQELATLADETSMTERRAAAAERELISWKQARFIEERLGDEFDALVVSVTEGGLWIELSELFIDGFVPLESFGDERMHYRENLRALVGARSKRRYTLGDRIRVRADRVSFDRLRCEFSCLGPAA